MSFVDWISALVLLVVNIAGLYCAFQAFVRRASVNDGVPSGKRGSLLMGLLYLGGALVAGAVMLLLVTQRLS